jgi:hypothetical protein
MAGDQLSRIAENKSLSVSNDRERFRMKAIELMTAIIKFFDSALLYFGRGSLRNTHFETITNFTQDNLFIDAMTDSEAYGKAKKNLEQAIENYDKASKDEMHYQTYKISADIARRICPRLVITHSGSIIIC